MVGYEFQLRPGTIAPVPPGHEATTLYVCPAEGGPFDGAAPTWQKMIGHVDIALLSFLMLIILVYVWILYIALVKDEVDEKTFEIPSMMLKILIGAFIVSRLLTNTPNYYRAVNVTGINTLFVLCENNSPGARAVRSEAVSAAPNIVR